MKTKKLTIKEKKEICQIIDGEGFDYALRNCCISTESEEFNNAVERYNELCEQIEKMIEWEKYGT